MSASPDGQPVPEMVDVVDDDDRVVATVSRTAMRAQRLQHRSVSVAVISTDGRLLVHRRADNKDVWPGMWDIAAGGVVAAGEGYLDAARRELAEELGVKAGSLEYLGKAAFADEAVALIGSCYVTVSDGPFSFTDGEIAEVRWVTRPELEALMATEAFVPDSLAILLPLLAPLLPGAGPGRYCRSGGVAVPSGGEGTAPGGPEGVITMSAMYGANPEQLASLGRTLKQQMSSIDAVMSTVTSVLGGTTWSGPARDQFETDWNQSFRTALNRLNQAFDAAGSDCIARSTDLMRVMGAR